MHAFVTGETWPVLPGCLCRSMRTSRLHHGCGTCGALHACLLCGHNGCIRGAGHCACGGHPAWEGGAPGGLQRCGLSRTLHAGAEHSVPLCVCVLSGSSMPVCGVPAAACCLASRPRQSVWVGGHYNLMSRLGRCGRHPGTCCCPQNSERPQSTHFTISNAWQRLSREDPSRYDMCRCSMPPCLSN